jgi:hypothetical protein
VIHVQARPIEDGWECATRVDNGGLLTLHSVRVAKKDLARWGRAGEGPEGLVRRAFNFLLSREPADQILSSFQIADIQQYFPEFDQEILNP